MPANFQRLRSGEPWKVTQVTAQAIIESAENWARHNRDVPAADAPEYVFQGNVLQVRNDSGSVLPRFSVAGLNGALITEANNLLEFQNYPRFSVVTPTAAHVDLFCITVEPLAPGAIGLAMFSGVVPVQILLAPGDPTPVYAGVLSGQTYLVPTSGGVPVSGGAPISGAPAGNGGANVLYCAPAPTSGSAQPVWAYVRIPEMQHYLMYGVAQSDWQEGGTRRADPYVSVELCTDRKGNNASGSAFNCYLPRVGDLDPAVYGKHTADTDWPAYPGDVIQFQYDTNGDAVAVGSYLGERIGSVKMWAGKIPDIPYGWHLCDGSTPSGSLLTVPGPPAAGQLPDLRGLFVRALESSPATLWVDGDQFGPAINNPGHAAGAGGRIGVSCTRQNATAAGTTAVSALEDVQSWMGAAADGEALDADGKQHDAVVCPPCYVLAMICRAK